MTDRYRLRQMRPAVVLRASVMSALRDFFRQRDFLDVSTPVRLPAPALEDYIEAQPSGDQWLRTSPELHMKRLLAAGYERVVQIGPCFRRGERGTCHLPEFTMLEWYRQNADWRDILADTVALFQAVADSCLGSLSCQFRGHRIDLSPPWPELTVEEAFRTFAGVDVDDALADGRFEQVLVEAVEPCLGLEKPTILSEYPLGGTGLSKALAGRPDRAERWELYIAGLELANACSEETDHREQLQRFHRTEELRRGEGREVFPLDRHFLDALEEGMPPCAGVAIGVDRLIMVLADASRIDEVVPFGADMDLT